MLMAINVFAQNTNTTLDKYNVLSKLIKENMEVQTDSVIIWCGIQMSLATSLKNDSLIINAQMSDAEALFNIGIYDECLSISY
jgi:hypothetical protein